MRARLRGGVDARGGIVAADDVSPGPAGSSGVSDDVPELAVVMLSSTCMMPKACVVSRETCALCNDSK